MVCRIMFFGLRFLRYSITTLDRLNKTDESILKSHYLAKQTLKALVISSNIPNNIIFTSNSTVQIMSTTSLLPSCSWWKSLCQRLKLFWMIKFFLRRLWIKQTYQNSIARSISKYINTSWLSRILIWYCNAQAPADIRCRHYWTSLMY